MAKQGERLEKWFMVQSWLAPEGTEVDDIDRSFDEPIRVEGYSTREEKIPDIKSEIE